MKDVLFFPVFSRFIYTITIIDIFPNLRTSLDGILVPDVALLHIYYLVYSHII